jgi:hypothetical protein
VRGGSVAPAAVAAAVTAAAAKANVSGVPQVLSPGDGRMSGVE